VMTSRFNEMGPTPKTASIAKGRWLIPFNSGCPRKRIWHPFTAMT